MFRRIVLCACGALLMAGCGDAGGLQGWDVTLVPTVDCTVTNATRDCADEAVLAQTKITGRWVFDRAEEGIGITITTHEGRTLAGIRFANDLSVIDTDGCRGEGGECTFVRRRVESVDANNNNCARVAELIIVGHVHPDDDDVFSGVFSDVSATSEECGTASATERVLSVVGARVDDPVLARQGLE